MVGLKPLVGGGESGSQENTTKTYSYPTSTGEVQITEQEKQNVFYERQVATGRATGKMESPSEMKDAIKDFYADLEKEKVIEPRLTDEEDDETLG